MGALGHHVFAGWSPGASCVFSGGAVGAGGRPHWVVNAEAMGGGCSRLGGGGETSSIGTSLATVILFCDGSGYFCAMSEKSLDEKN